MSELRHVYTCTYVGMYIISTCMLAFVIMYSEKVKWDLQLCYSSSLELLHIYTLPAGGVGLKDGTMD